MGSLLDDAAMIHDQDHLRVPDRRESVGDYETGSTLHKLAHSLLNSHLGSGIDDRWESRRGREPGRRVAGVPDSGE
jgi:hypothetical protein